MTKIFSKLEWSPRGKKVIFAIPRNCRRRKKMNDEVKFLENRLKEIGKEIKQAENEKKSIDKELDEAELKAELMNNEIAYFDILIRELVAEYGAEGEEIFRQEYPELAEEILKARSKE